MGRINLKNIPDTSTVTPQDRIVGDVMASV